MSDDVLETTSIKDVVYENSSEGQFLVENGEWETSLFIKNFQIIKLNKDNNFSVNLSFYFDSLDNIEVIPVISTIFLPEYMKGYNIESNLNLSTKELSVNHQMEILKSEPSYMYTTDMVSTQYVYPNCPKSPITIEDLKEYHFSPQTDFAIVAFEWAGNWTGSEFSSISTLNYYQNETLIFSKRASSERPETYLDNIYPLDSNIPYIKIIPKCEYYEVYIWEFYAQPTPNEDLEITCFVFQGGEKI